MNTIFVGTYFVIDFVILFFRYEGRLLGYEVHHDKKEWKLELK